MQENKLCCSKALHCGDIFVATIGQEFTFSSIIHIRRGAGEDIWSWEEHLYGILRSYITSYIGQVNVL